MGIKASFNAWKNRVLRRIESLIEKYQAFYLGLICLLAITGYLLSLIFPLLVIICISALINILTNDSQPDWMIALIYLTVALLSTLLCLRQIQYKPVAPAGVALTADKLPDIFNLVETNQKHFKRPKIRQLVITQDYEIDIIKTPLRGLPFWSYNTLVIGLPMLLCFSPKQFECMITRKIGQFSKKRNPVTNWLYQLRSTWQQYARAFDKQKYPDSKILYWIYNAFSVFYSATSVYIARRDELNADGYALEIHNHEYVREMISAHAVYYLFLQNNFWPAIQKAISANPRSAVTPHRQLVLALRSHLQGKNLQPLADKAFNTQYPWNSPQASMISRLNNITHDSPHLAERTEQTAASQYLGNMQVAIISLIDKLWLNNTLQKNRKPRKK